MLPKKIIAQIDHGNRIKNDGEDEILHPPRKTDFLEIFWKWARKKEHKE